MPTWREFLDAILDFIGSESLTDAENDALGLSGTPDYTKEAYEALKLVLEGREDVSGQGKRLKLYFIAKGVDLSTSPATYIPKSNILIGGEL